MRDIRTDLRERLNAAEESRSVLNNQLSVLTAEISTLMKLLELEDSRFEFGSAATLPAQKVRPLSVGAESRGAQGKAADDTLVDFILSFTKMRPRTKREIRDAAVNELAFKPSESPGRVVHLTLLNLERAGKVNRLPDDRYSTTKNSAGSPTTDHPAEMRK
jgi:hypothetical protein